MQNQNQTTRPNGHPAPTGQPPAPAFSEAPASLTLKISYRGYNDVLFTLRSNSGVDLLSKLDAVLDRLEKMGAEPAPARDATPAGAGQANGAPAEPPICRYHGPMKPSKKHGGWYCPKKMGDGSYCQEKVDG